MSGPLERAAAFFLAPPAPAAAPAEAAAAAPAARAVVLGAPADVVPLAAATALALRPPALVAIWAAERTPVPGIATRAAARLSAGLAARGMPAVARGRLAWLCLPPDAVEAAAVVRRASAVVSGPLVTALAGPRPPALEELVAEHDLAIVAADPEGPLARAALARLAARGVDARAHRPLRRGLPRAIALAGLAASRERMRRRLRDASGQATVLLVGALAAILVGVLILGAVARGVAREAAAQRAADLGALAGAKAMHDAYGRLFEPAPRHLSRESYLALAADVAERVARANGADAASVRFPDGDTFAPVRIRVGVRERVEVVRNDARRRTTVAVAAEAELAPAETPITAGGGYDGPLAYRQGKPMRPDVALAFDRLERAARAAGVALIVSSAYRSDGEQAVLFRAHPDPKWVAPPGTSLHRFATELDLGPSSAYAWLAANAHRFHFVQRYAWEPWHWGYSLNPRSTPRPGGGGEHASALPSFVPDRYAPMLARAAQRWNVSAALLAAQLYAESNFNPFVRSPAGAEGIAQFMPGTAHALGLADPFDPERAIDAQAHLMRDLLRRFASVPLALAAYNAGPGAVAPCMCIPPYPETRGYVARIVGLLGGAGDLPAGVGLEVRLVR
jgi:soluble lytic murein transglycosylase-like protein